MTHSVITKQNKQTEISPVDEILLYMMDKMYLSNETLQYLKENNQTDKIYCNFTLHKPKSILDHYLRGQSHLSLFTYRNTGRIT